MTVCIAAICRYNGIPRILLCSDGRLDYGYSGSTDDNIKISDIGHGWSSMFASDDWASAEELKAHITLRWQEFPSPDTKEAAYTIATVILEEFLKSPFNRKKTKEIILCGYTGDPPSPIIFKALVSSKKALLDPVPTFATIGSGGYIAQVLLTLRNCAPTDPMETAAYKIFEAKRYSERASGVGPGTLMGALAPLDPGMPGYPSKKAQLNASARLFLEDQFKQFGLQPIPVLADFPDEFFVRGLALPNLQPPKAAP